MDGTVLWQRGEGALIFLAGIGLYAGMDGVFSLWSAILIFFAPDISFAAYLAGPKVGAFVYNAVHIYGFGASLFVIGVLLAMPVLIGCGALWLAHSGFDRTLGYGLKSERGFAETHLGRIGRAE